MSKFFERFRKTASRVYKRKSDDDELHPLQEAASPYSSSCYSLYQACIVGDVEAVRWYINKEKVDVNKTDKTGVIPLLYAVKKNHIVIVKDLIKAGADVNLMSTFDEGVSIYPTHAAATFDRDECMKILLEHGADPNQKNLFGQTPLHSAARMKLKSSVNVLINIGKADVTVADHDNVTPLHLVATSGRSQERKHVAKKLLDSGANPYYKDNEGNTVFHEAAENGIDDVLELLFYHKGYEKNGFSSIAEVLNNPRNDGYNCLHLAVENGHEKVIQMCIDKKADINQKTVDGDSSLHIACTKGHLNVCKMLLDNGANLKVTDKNSTLPIHRAASKGHVDCLAYLIEKGTNIDVFHHCGSALVNACYYKQSKAVKYLLNAGASPTKRNLVLDTCLHVAVKNGDVATVKVIMENCGETLLEMKDKEERTAMHLAARNGNAEVLEILLAYNPDLRAGDDRGKSPVHTAAENGNLECAKLLVGADKCCVYLTDAMWRTPLHLACATGYNTDLVKFLLDSGADVNARDDRRWTALLYVGYVGCPYNTKTLVEYGAKIDEWDKNRMTALTLAASHNHPMAVKTLLENGADPTILTCAGLSCMDIALKNRFHDVCMVIAKSDKWKDALVSTSTMENCLELSPEVAKVILDRCVEYSGKEIDADYKVTYNFELLDPHPDENDSYYGPLVMKMARRSELLTHPLTKKLLEVNWRHGVRFIYYTEMFFLAVFLILLTLFLVWIRRLTSQCYHSSGSADQSAEFFTKTNQFCSPKVEYNHSLMWVARCAICVYFTWYLLKEMKQLYKERFNYFHEITNLLDVSVCALFLAFVQVPSSDLIPYDRLKYGILGIFSYYFLIFLWSRGLSRYGIYVTMFLEVLATLLQVLSAFALLFLCFAVTFYMVFVKDEAFRHFQDSLLKTLAMMLGELDYAGFRDIADDLPDGLEISSLLLFIIFCFTMSLVVNNLLIGLAVGDIESVQKNAEIKLLSLQVNQVLEARSKMIIPMVLRKFYVASFTDMPNKTRCHGELSRERKVRERNLKKQRKKRQFLEDMFNVAVVKNEHAT